jgi:iron complex outermembrane receptor protein
VFPRRQSIRANEVWIYFKWFEASQVRHKYLSVTALIAYGISTAAVAQQETIEEVVITSSPFAVSLDSATTNVDVIDSFALDIAQPSGLGDVLGGIPGVRSSFFGAGSSRPIIRGLAGPRVQVLTNGIGTIDASALSPDHAVASDPGEAQRIEVLRGPAALAYGGSAIGGVVNVIDERVARSPAEGATDGRLTASGTTGNDGYSTSGSLKIGSGPIVFTFDGLQRRSGDYAIPGFAESRFQRALEEEAGEGESEAFGTVPNSGVRLTVLGGGVSYVADPGFLGFSLKHTDTQYGIPGHTEGMAEGHAEEEGGAEEVDIDLKQWRFDLHGEREVSLGPFALVRLASGYSDYEHVELEGGAAGTRFLSDGYEGRLELVQEERDGWQGAVGFQGSKRNFDAIGEEAYVPKTTIDDFGAFTLQRLDKNGWGIEGGIRVDNRKLDSLAGERSFTNVSASAGAFLRPSDPWFLGLSLARTARAPHEEELFSNGPHVATRGFEIGDPELSSEVAYSADASVHYDGGMFSADLHLFIARYDGFIDTVPTGAVEDGLNVFQYTQTNADFRGFELELGQRVWEMGSRSITLEGVADYVFGDTDNGPPARIPPYSFTGRVVYESVRWSGKVELRHVGKQNRLAEFELPSDSYTMMNAAMEFRPNPDEGLSFFVAADNLTDEEGREHTSFLKDLVPLPGRSFRFGATYRF